jgi:hypothetical protein
MNAWISSSFHCTFSQGHMYKRSVVAPKKRKKDEEISASNLYNPLHNISFSPFFWHPQMSWRNALHTFSSALKDPHHHHLTSPTAQPWIVFWSKSRELLLLLLDPSSLFFPLLFCKLYKQHIVDSQSLGTPGRCTSNSRKEEIYGLERFPSTGARWLASDRRARTRVLSARYHQ